MELIELYNQIRNPIDDPSVIEKLVTAYANSSKGFGGYYGQLTKTVQKEHNKGAYYVQDADRFHAMLFNKWKNSIVNMTREEFIELYKKGSYGADFVKMRNYLKTVPDVTTMKEANEILSGKNVDDELKEALDKYTWKALGRESGWVHVCSRYLTAKKDKYPNVEHRLYLDTESLDTYKMVTYLVEKCDEHHLPYYFKFDQFADRDDTIVIYSSTENLTKYVEILQEIKKEHPELVSRTKEPPVLTGRIDGWIGYGSEPAKTPDGKRHSFNEVRSNLLEKSIEKVTMKWIMNHRNQVITYQGQKISFTDYIAMKSTEKIIADLERKYLFNEDNQKKIAQRDGTTYNQSIVNDRLGYTLQDIRSQQFKQKVFLVLKDRMPNTLSRVYNGSFKDVEPINMNVRNGKQISFREYDLETVIQQLSINISKNDPEYIKSIQEEIKTNAKQYGIDSEKFCFDIKMVDKIKNIPQKEEQKQEISDQQVIQEQKPIETTKPAKAIDMNALNAQTIIDIINPALLERKMKLPNGREIPAKQYIQEIVYPQLPQNGIVILNNGGILPIKQFIEEGVMFECQEKYNGDFSRYMVERTKNNLDVISIEYYNKKYIIHPVEITDYINPALLDKKITLPNGVDISVKQYIQEIYASHIPTNGMVILSNGVEIPVIQYIEEELLWKQEQYNGDINQILYNTTRNNTGTVTADPKKLQETLINMRKQTNALNNQQNNQSL